MVGCGFEVLGGSLFSRILSLACYAAATHLEFVGKTHTHYASYTLCVRVHEQLSEFGDLKCEFYFLFNRSLLSLLPIPLFSAGWALWYDRQVGVTLISSLHSLPGSAWV